MNPAIESLQAIGIDIWLPLTAIEQKPQSYSLMNELKNTPCLVLIAAEDYQNWQALQELLFNILKWLKLDPQSYCLAFLNSTPQDKAYTMQDLLAQVKPRCVISFGVKASVTLDSKVGIGYFETLALTRVLNNVDNKRRVMNDFASFSL
ncbi:MAG: hypothetical protein K0Q57_1200 [Gammaproteobacteria bacterium]|jgi:hypothetical protein|nr:hypothetical protein [Gammaproteobacteria bacterium]